MNQNFSINFNIHEIFLNFTTHVLTQLARVVYQKQKWLQKKDERLFSLEKKLIKVAHKYYAKV